MTAVKTNYAKALNEVTNRINKRKHTILSLRKEFKKGYAFSHLPFNDQILIWDFIWKKADTTTVKIQAFFFCEINALKEKNRVRAWEVLKHWQNEVNDWSFCDGLSKIYTKKLEFFPEEVYPLLLKWNTDKDLWKRRQSIVALLYYRRTKKTILPYPKILPLIHNLVLDQEYYVQKAVGWSLRELYNAYPEQTYSYLLKNIKKISAVAFFAATEKLTLKQKQQLKVLRK